VLRRRIQIGLLVSVAVLGGCSKEQSAKELAPELAALYTRWSRAGLAGDIDAWSQTSSASSQQKARNGMVSMKRNLTRTTLQAMARNQPDLDDYEFIHAALGKDTAITVYYGGRADQNKHFLILDFIREAGEWKFHWLTQRDDLTQAAQQWTAGNTDFLQDKVFQPMADVPPPQADCPIPDHIAYVAIKSLGYETRMRMHGIVYDPVVDLESSWLIVCGVRRGSNVAEFSIQPLATGGVRSFRAEISIAEPAEGTGELVVTRQFAYEPAAPPANYTWEVDVP